MPQTDQGETWSSAMFERMDVDAGRHMKVEAGSCWEFLSDGFYFLLRINGANGDLGNSR